MGNASIAQLQQLAQPSQVGSEQGNHGDVSAEDKDMGYELGKQEDNEALVGSNQGNDGNVAVKDKDLEYELWNQGDNEALVGSMVKAYGAFNDDEETVDIKGRLTWMISGISSPMAIHLVWATKAEARKWKTMRP